jgi:hypothetical protein
MAATPELLIPLDKSVARLGSLEFSWESVDGGVDRYVLQIALDEAFSNIILSLETTLTRVEAAFPLGAEYFWRVRAIDGGDTLTSTTVRALSAPAFQPATIETHEADGKSLLLSQFQENQ